MKPRGKRSPFKPGFGRLPPTLAGRQDIQNKLDDELERLTAKETDSSAFLLTGPRGCGKTSLLNWLQKHRRAARLAIHDFTIDSGMDPDSRPARKPQPTRTTRKTGVRIGTPDLHFGLHRELAQEEPEPDPADMARKLRRLASGKPLLLLLDETHMVNPVTARPLLLAYQSIAQHHPMLLVMAGTPDTEMHLSSIDVSFVERTRTFSVGRLDPDAAFRAIADPLTDAGIGHDDKAIVRAAEEAQRYPYFLQCMGEAIWDAVAADDAAHVDAAVTKRAAATAARAIRKFYGERAAELHRHRVLVGAAELALASPADSPSRAAVGALIFSLSRRWRLTATPPPRWLRNDDPLLAAEQLLLHTGFVWKPDSGKWEFGIPSLAAHVTDAAANQISDLVSQDGAAPALQALLQVSDDFVGSRADIERSASKALDGNQRRAQAVVDKLLEVGAIGPISVRKSDLALLTPRVVEAALEAAGRHPATARTPAKPQPARRRDL